MTVGRKTIALNDSTRIDPTDNETRKILLSIYYPSEAFGFESKYISMFEPCTPLAIDMLTNMGVNNEYITKLVTGICNNAAVRKDTGNCPVILLSPAFGVVRDMYSYCVEHLVNCGFIVIAIGATHESIFSIFPDGSFLHQSTEISDIDSLDIQAWKGLLKLRVDDVNYVISHVDEILDSVENLGAIVDLNKMGIIGHSLGGATAYEVLNKESKVKAGILLDPSFHLMNADSKATNNSLLVIRQEKCSAEELDGEISKDLLPLLLEGYNTLYHTSDHNSFYLKLRGAHHMTFSDIPIHYQEEGIELYHSIVNKYISAFFDEHFNTDNLNFQKLMISKSIDGIDEINSKGQVQ